MNKCLNKRIYALLAAFLMCCTLLTVFTATSPVAHAENITGWWSDDTTLENGMTWQEAKNELDAKSGMLGVAWEIVTAAYGANPHWSMGAIAANIYKFSSYQGDWTILGSKKTSMLDIAEGMYSAMSVVGIALIFLYFLIELLDEAQADNFNTEHLVKKLITLAVALVVVANGGALFRAVANFGDAMVDEANNVAAAGMMYTSEVSALYNTLINAGGTGIFSAVVATIVGLSMAMQYLIPYLLTLIACLLAYLTGFSRFMEFLIRFAFAPVGCAPLVSGGTRGAGMRYIKKFASCVLQGAVCVLAFNSVTMIQAASNQINSFFGSFIIPFTLIGFLSRVPRIADDIVGV